MPAKPKSVRIGPQTFKIEFRDPANDGMLNDGNVGYTVDAGNLIVVSDKISASKQQITLFHEILHAMRMIFENGMPKKGASYEEWEHYFIGIYENSILMMIRDNPELVEWLKQD